MGVTRGTEECERPAGLGKRTVVALQRVVEPDESVGVGADPRGVRAAARAAGRIGVLGSPLVGACLRQAQVEGPDGV
jgi:hypothetical protein